MGLLTAILQDTATIYTQSYNKHGDVVKTESASYPCRIRYISELDRTLNMEEMDSDAQAWFEPTAPITEGTIFSIDDIEWRVQRVLKARRFIGNVLFLKTLLKRHDIAESS